MPTVERTVRAAINQQTVRVLGPAVAHHIVAAISERATRGPGGLALQLVERTQAGAAQEPDGFFGGVTGHVAIVSPVEEDGARRQCGPKVVGGTLVQAQQPPAVVVSH